MKNKLLLAVFIALATALPRTSPAAANILAYTHLLPSPLTLPAGRLQYGTEFAYGITDFLQVGTNVLDDAFQIFNADARLGMIETDQFAFSPFVTWQTFNYDNIQSTNPNVRVTSWMPGMVTGFALDPTLAVFFGGNLNLTKTNLLPGGYGTSGLMHGATLESDISWAYTADAGSSSGKTSPDQQPRRAPKLGNVLSGGISYDTSFDLFGFGISHHWGGFQLGVHYYPAATTFKILPIIAGGGSVDL